MTPAPLTKSRPLILTGEDVSAILAGRKTQHRVPVLKSNSLIDGSAVPKRLYGVESPWSFLDFAKATVDPGPSPAGNAGPYLKVPFPPAETVHRVYPNWQVGERLWVKEKFWPAFPRTKTSNGCAYFSDYIPPTTLDPQVRFSNSWQSASRMPQWASRLTLEITEVRVQRLQDISEDDAVAEGAEDTGLGINMKTGEPEQVQLNPIEGFACIWDRLHSPDAWSRNDWVWVLTFRVLGGAK